MLSTPLSMPTTPATKSLHIYRASAGSGKTFLLTAEYLSLLFLHRYKYREILAVTFTNKATEEMKHRILEELRCLATDQPSDYKKILLQRYPALAEGNQLATQADQVYRTILHDYAKFAVSTIDSFVQQVIRSFAYEIGLDAGYEIQLNQELVKQDLADRLFQQLDTNTELLNWIRRMALERIDSGKSWDFRDELLNFASEIFKEQFFLFEANMRALPDPAASFEEVHRRLSSQVKDFEDQLAGFGQNALQLISEGGLSIDDFANKKSGFAGYFQKLVNKKELKPPNRALAAVDNLDSWTSKATEARVKAQVADLYAPLNKILSEAIQCYQQKGVEYNTAKVVLQQLGQLNLLRVLAEQLADYRRDNNALLITDTQQLLRELVRDNEAPFIYEKTGNRYQHFLLDEFQDTSIFQWDNFRPLIEQSIAAGHFNLIVGDVKQSIYRWRNGDWRLLQEQVKKDIGANQVEEAVLQENYRSRKNIIRFNNYLFQEAPQILQNQFNHEMADVDSVSIQQKLQTNGYFKIIAQAYADASQQMPENCSDGGHIECRFFEKASSGSANSWRPEAEAWLCALIDELITEKGIDAGQITLLTRGNADARWLIDLLLQYQQTQASKVKYGLVSTDALVVKSSPAIQLLLAALRYLINEKDHLALAELIQANALRQHCSLNNIDWYRTELNHAMQQLPEAFTQNKKTLLQGSFYACIEALIGIFKIDEWTSEQAYTLAFRDLVNQFGFNGNADIRSFLTWWAEEGENETIPMSSAANAIQVMTIHKSKGLAFDVVILPYADWPLASHRGMLWCPWNNSPEGIAVIPVSISTTLAHTDFAYEYFEEQLMAKMDALNILYVALTRTREAMYVMAPKPSAQKEKDGALKTIADLLWQCMQNSEAGLNTAMDGDGLKITGVIKKKTAVAGGQNTLRILPSSTAFFMPANKREPSKSELLLQSTASVQQKTGQLAHLALARVTTMQELNRVISQMEMEGILSGELTAAVKQKVQQALGHPQLGKWFTGDYIMLSEKAILLKGGAVKRPDKVFAGSEETILVDFKFTQAAAAAHGHQLKQYQELLQQMGYPAVQAYVYYGFNQSLVPLAQLASAQGNLFTL
jgi:ATP-dependent helicase/nuclease subunit A